MFVRNLRFEWKLVYRKFMEHCFENSKIYWWSTHISIWTFKISDPVDQISDPLDQIFEGFFYLLRDFDNHKLLLMKNFLVEVNKQTQSFQMHQKLLETNHYAGFCVRKCMRIECHKNLVHTEESGVSTFQLLSSYWCTIFDVDQIFVTFDSRMFSNTKSCIMLCFQ